MPATAIAEPIAAGLIVALLNKYLINNPNLFSCCTLPPVKKDVDECSSSSSTSSYVDAEVVHPHIHVI